MTISGVTISPFCECARPIPDIDTGDCVKCGHALAGLGERTPESERRKARRKPQVRVPALVPVGA